MADRACKHCDQQVELDDPIPKSASTKKNLSEAIRAMDAITEYLYAHPDANSNEELWGEFDAIAATFNEYEPDDGLCGQCDAKVYKEVCATYRASATQLLQRINQLRTERSHGRTSKSRR
jgi:hypothetical protein